MTTSKLLPTPRSSMTGDIREERKNDKNQNLEVVLSRKLIPTPTGTDYKSRGPNSKQNGIDNLFKKDIPTVETSEQLPLFSRAAFPASPFPVPGNEEARKMTVTSGRKCLELYQKQGPVGLLAKMLVGSSIWGSTTVFLTWKLKATKCNRLLYQLVPKTPRTEGTGCGLLHTPAQQEPGVNVERLQTKKGEPAKVGERAYDKETGRLAQVGLHQQIAMLPTPRASDYKGASKQTEAKGRNPMTNSCMDAIENGTNRGLKLQPAFALWMMGYPEDWCDLEDGE